MQEIMAFFTAQDKIVNLIAAVVLLGFWAWALLFTHRRTPMKIEHALTRRNQAVTATKDLFHSAKTYKTTSSQLHYRCREIVSGMGKDCPEWAKEFVRGYQTALIDALYEHLVYGGFLGKTFYSVDSKRADYYGNVASPQKWLTDSKQRGYYWPTTKTVFLIGSEDGQQEVKVS